MLIAIDHGNKLCKTPNHEPFTSGLQESETQPFGGETLKYKGKYYTLSGKRIPYQRDKSKDERFYILTLFAIAYEIEATDSYSPGLMRIKLAVGLPLPTMVCCARRLPATLRTVTLLNLSFTERPIPSILIRSCVSPRHMPPPSQSSIPSRRNRGR